MKEFKKILPFTKGLKSIYLFGMISVIISVIFNILRPLVIRTTLDSIFGTAPIESKIMERIIVFFGGREYLLNRLWIVGIIIIVITLLRGLFMLIKNICSSYASEEMTKRMRDGLYDHIQKLPYEYHVKADTGDLIQRCTSDVETIRRFLSVQLVEMAGSIFMLVLIVVIMFTMNTTMAIISLVVLPFLFFFAYYFFGRIQKEFKKADEAEAQMSTVIQENLTGIRVVKAFSMENYEIEKFDKKNQNYKSLLDRLILNLAYYWSISDFISMLEVASILVIGTVFVVRGEITLGTLFAFLNYVNMIIYPVRQMGRMLTDMGKATISIQRIDEIFSEPIEILRENGEEPPIEGNIEFKNVYFSYDGKKYVLKDISFEVKKGQTVAIIGSTGSGKSSLVHLLPRLYDYDKGSIKIDGRELKTIDKAWIRKNVGLILQEPFLYARTIKENIKFANPTVDDHSVFNAAKIASVDKDIREFEDEYETLVGERGVSLSGGQKQRIAIARTIINDTPIVIFDDSLSAVDTETDVQIRNALKSRQNKSTTIIISHRISTVSEADLILVLEDGKIIERGTHEELINSNGLYKRIYEIQSSIEDELELEMEV
ncbi:MAG: ABC transporter ATP-binding protein [Tissierellales bacterium]|nr:ABC transporter ATP-binding protein [Tissierellales bacterium]